MAQPRLETAWSVHVVADSDTRWKWGTALAAHLRDGAAGGVRLHGHLLDGRGAPSAAQLTDVGATCETLHHGGTGDVLARIADARPDVVVLACVGGTIQALLHGLARRWDGRPERPVLVTGYVGIVYERVVDGLLLRVGADVVLANSPTDAARFREVFRAAGADPTAVVPSVLPYLAGAAHDPSAAGRARPFTVTVATQPGVPGTRRERAHLMAQAVEHATLHPQRAVVLKLRARPGEQSTHREPFPYPTVSTGETLPANLAFVHGPMSDVLDRTDLCVTVSSTAALEAAHRGIPVGILTDFGVRESLGNHVFLGSGALTSWPRLHAGAIPRLDPAWGQRHGVTGIGTGTLDAALAPTRAAVADLVARRGTLPPLRPWFTPADAAAYLPTLLARNGLAEDGSPRLGDPTAAAAVRTPRRALRAGARRAYRFGVTRVEPRLRAWANS